MAKEELLQTNPEFGEFANRWGCGFFSIILCIDDFLCYELPENGEDARVTIADVENALGKILLYPYKKSSPCMLLSNYCDHTKIAPPILPRNWGQYDPEWHFLIRDWPGVTWVSYLTVQKRLKERIPIYQNSPFGGIKTRKEYIIAEYRNRWGGVHFAGHKIDRESRSLISVFNPDPGISIKGQEPLSYRSLVNR